jgi:predicted nucleic acid-binding protein
MYLLDTNVISETRKPRPHGAVLAWVAATPRWKLHLPAVALGELQRGVMMVRETDQVKAREIHLWIDYVSSAFEILSPDAEVFREWAEMMENRSMELWQDTLIAATARVHRLIVATRNERDFDGLNVEVFNPFTYSGGFSD